MVDLAGDVDAVLDEAGLKNAPVREYVRLWAEHTGAERVEVVSASDDSRLICEALEVEEILPRGRAARPIVDHAVGTMLSSGFGSSSA